MSKSASRKVRTCLTASGQATSSSFGEVRKVGQGLQDLAKTIQALVSSRGALSKAHMDGEVCSDGEPCLGGSTGSKGSLAMDEVMPSEVATFRVQLDALTRDIGTEGSSLLLFASDFLSTSLSPYPQSINVNHAVHLSVTPITGLALRWQRDKPTGVMNNSIKLSVETFKKRILSMKPTMDALLEKVAQQYSCDTAGAEWEKVQAMKSALDGKLEEFAKKLAKDARKQEAKLQNKMVTGERAEAGNGAQSHDQDGKEIYPENKAGAVVSSVELEGATSNAPKEVANEMAHQNAEMELLVEMNACPVVVPKLDGLSAPPADTMDLDIIVAQPEETNDIQACTLVDGQREEAETQEEKYQKVPTSEEVLEHPRCDVPPQGCIIVIDAAKDLQEEIPDTNETFVKEERKDKVTVSMEPLCNAVKDTQCVQQQASTAEKDKEDSVQVGSESISTSRPQCHAVSATEHAIQQQQQPQLTLPKKMQESAVEVIRLLRQSYTDTWEEYPSLTNVRTVVSDYQKLLKRRRLSKLEALYVQTIQRGLEGSNNQFDEVDLQERKEVKPAEQPPMISVNQQEQSNHHRVQFGNFDKDMRAFLEALPLVECRDVPLYFGYPAKDQANIGEEPHVVVQGEQEDVTKPGLNPLARPFIPGSLFVNWVHLETYASEPVTAWGMEDQWEQNSEEVQHVANHPFTFITEDGREFESVDSGWGIVMQETFSSALSHQDYSPQSNAERKFGHEQPPTINVA